MWKTKILNNSSHSFQHISKILIGSPDFPYFQHLSCYPWSLIDHVVLKLSTTISNTSVSFTGQELMLFAKAFGHNEKDAAVIHLPFSQEAPMKIDVNIKYAETNTEFMNGYKKFLNKLLFYLPKDLVDIVCLFVIVPKRPNISIYGLDFTDKYKFHQRCLFVPSGQTKKYGKQVFNTERFPVVHVTWAYIDPKEPYNIINTNNLVNVHHEKKNNSVTDICDGVYKAFFVSDNIIRNYRKNNIFHAESGKKGLRKISIQEDPSLPKHVQIVMIKHSVHNFMYKKYFKWSNIEDSSDDDDDDEFWNNEEDEI